MGKRGNGEGGITHLSDGRWQAQALAKRLVDTRRDVLANISQHDCVSRAEGIGA